MYTVAAGDSLSKIAKHFYGDASKYNAIFVANQPMLKESRQDLPRQVLRIPPLGPDRGSSVVGRPGPAAAADRRPAVHTQGSSRHGRSPFAFVPASFTAATTHSPACRRPRIPSPPR
ncbi:MAG: LysM peptidoglycan-binding domain-containing protein [Thermoanaerobaculia bacterium]